MDRFYCFEFLYQNFPTQLWIKETKKPKFFAIVACQKVRFAIPQIKRVSAYLNRYGRQFTATGNNR